MPDTKSAYAFPGVRAVKKRVGATMRSGVLLALMAALLWQNEAVGQAVRQGLALCARSVIPALFPFFAAVSFAVDCGFFDMLRQLGLPRGTAVFLLGAMGGYPVGARTVGELYRGGGLSRQGALRLLSCCNNAGPSFILSLVGTGVFGSRRAGLVLYGIHLLAAMAAGGLSGAFSAREDDPPRRGGRNVPAPNAAALFVSCVRHAALSMVHICAFVVFFQALTALIQAVWPALPAAAAGVWELTTGIAALSPSPAGFCTAAALLGWGGVSVHCQTAAVLADTDLPLGRYLAAKALQAAISAPLAWAVWPLLSGGGTL